LFIKKWARCNCEGNKKPQKPNLPKQLITQLQTKKESIMQRATSVIISSALVFATVIASSAQATTQDPSNFQVQNSRQQIESANQPQGCFYIPGLGYRCF
jgi:hypothetical protein